MARLNTDSFGLDDCRNTCRIRVDISSYECRCSGESLNNFDEILLENEKQPTFIIFIY